MKIRCGQCGGPVEMTGPDSLARCPWCGARSRFVSPGGVFMQMAAVAPREAERMFPSGAVSGVELLWFPYSMKGSRMVRAFSQPYPSMDDYSPPSGDLRPWPDSVETEGRTIPAETHEGRLVYHPVYSIEFRDGRPGSMVDGVSGGIIGAVEPVRKGSGSPERLFMWFALAGLVPSTLIYLALHRVSPALSFLVSAPAAYLTASLLWRRLGNPR